LQFYNAMLVNIQLSACTCMCFDIVNCTFRILCGVFDYALFQLGHILQKVELEKPKSDGHTKNLDFGFSKL